MRMVRRSGRGPAGDVAAVFPDREAARAAVEDLCTHGADPRLRTALNEGEARVYELDLGAQVARRVTVGGLVGMPVGAIVGAIVVRLALAGDVLTGLSGLDAVWAGGLPGIVAGLVFGAFAGLVSALWVFEDIDRWWTVRLDDPEVLVVARAHGDERTVRRTLERHGGRTVGVPEGSDSGGRER